jgi:hypothetical protein
MTDDKLPARLVPPLPGETGRSHWHISPLGVQMVEELAARGCHVTTIAAALGMSRDGWMGCRRRQPEVEEAYQRGVARECDALVGNLRTLADKGNIVANLFLLKTKHGFREGDNPELNVNINNGGVVVVPQKQTMEEFLAEARAEGRIVVPVPRDVGTIEARLDPETRRGD